MKLPRIKPRIEGDTRVFDHTKPAKTTVVKKEPKTKKPA